MDLRPDPVPPAEGPPGPSATVAARLVEALPDGILAFDGECRYTAWNPGMERISGMPAAEVLGRVAWEVFPFLADEGEDAFFRAALAGEERTVGDRRFRIPETGREGYFQARYAPLRDARGAVVGGMALIRDVTESRAADQALRMQARVLASMSEGVSVSDEEGIILYTNPAEDRMFGYGPGELAGKHVTVQNAYAPDENRRTVDEVIAELHASGVWTGEWRNRRKDGAEFFTWSRITALEMAGRRYWVCVQEDVTERKAARAALEAARDEAERRAAALRDSERRFRSFVEASAQIVWRAEPAGRMAHVQGWSALTGQEADETGLAGWLEALHPDDREPTREAWTRAVAAGALYEHRFRVRTAAGAYRWFQARAVPVPGDDGGVREWVGTIADVDDGVRAEERRAFLAEASRLLGASLELDETLAAVARYCVPFLADHASVDLLGGDGRIRRVAGAHADPEKEAVLREMWARYPYDPDARVGAPEVIRTGRPIVLPRVDSGETAAFARDEAHAAMLRTLDSRSYVCVPLAARGSVFGALSLVFSGSGRTYGDEEVEVARELAGRAAVAIEHARLFADAGAARARAEIAEAELSRVFSQAPVAICVLRGPEHVYEVANPHYRALLGGRDPVGKTLREVLPKIEGQGVLDVLERVYASGEPFAADAFPVTYDRHGDGTMETRYFTLVYQPLRDGTGAVAGIVTIATEVTEQVRGRQEAVRLQAEAEEANRAKSLFLATMSHEIRTPINAIMGYADLMELGLAGPLTPLQREQLARVKSSSRHLLGLVNDVLDLAKVESGEMVVAREEGKLASAAEEALALVAPQAAAAGLALEDGCRGAGLRYAGDPDRVRQVLVNLLSNAVKFTPAGGRISLGCAAVELGGEGAPAGEGAWTAVWVEDTGIGIAPELQAVVFEPFVQAESGHTRRAGGTGLGLTISRRLARLMGGDLTLCSTPGEGSRFTLWIPAAAD